VTVLQKHRRAIELWGFGGLPLLILALFVHVYFIAPLIVLFIVIVVYQLSFRCPRCSKLLLWSLFGVFQWRRCRLCGFDLRTEE
jgi:hypothetical protein